MKASENFNNKEFVNRYHEDLEQNVTTGEVFWQKNNSRYKV